MDTYKHVIEKYFGEHLLDSYLTGQNEHYNNALQLKENYKEIWETLKQKIKGYEVVKWTRDLAGGAVPQTNKLLIGLHAGARQGIILNISYLTKMIGFYYCDYDSKAQIPIVDEYLMSNNIISYHPFNELQEQFTLDILSHTDILFPEFSLFNNLFAGRKAKKVVVDCRIQTEMDYFQVFFDHNMAAIM